MDFRKDEEVEDLVGEVQYTDSQKSVTISAVYSQDFTDSSPERHNSSGKQTYVLDRDSDDSEATFHFHRGESLVHLNEAVSPKPLTPTDMNHLLYDEINKSIRDNFRNHALADEFTQTSKTIIELARNEVIVVHKPIKYNSLETQTSFGSITEHQTKDYKIQSIDKDCNINNNEVPRKDVDTCHNNTSLLPDIEIPLKDTKELLCVTLSPNLNAPEPIVTKETMLTTDKELAKIKELKKEKQIPSEHSFEDQMIHFIDDESKDTEDNIEVHETTSDIESSKYDTDIEEDSLMLESEYRSSSKRSKGDNASETSEMQMSIENDVEELYGKLSESPLLLRSETTPTRTLKIGTLTPLSEETSRTRSFLDMTNSSQTLMEPTKDTDDETLFVSNEVKVKMFANCEVVRDKDKFKLPPIHTSCPPSPHLNFLFSVNSTRAAGNAGVPPSLDNRKGEISDRWEFRSKELASGESPLISGGSDPVKLPRELVHLPPIHMEGPTCHNTKQPASLVPRRHSPSPDAISIRGRIKELKTTNNRAWSKMERSCSPISNVSREDSRPCDAAERGCDNLCVELLRRLRSSSWVEVLETLEDIPRSLEKHWPVLSVNRTAELLRQVTVLIDSPRTQVARSACGSLAEILKNTNYTRKPDFYEAVSMLLTKTGSFSRPVRRAANVALDDIACGVDVTHAACAVCIYGVGHKSALVRCASARLLVVCCALAEGGRQVLRSRPPSAAAARRHVLRALAELLQDKNIDTRKYGERLYAMLRPLPAFEAYFLSDVDAELAARHMKKYDPLLLRHTRDSAMAVSIFS